MIDKLIVAEILYTTYTIFINTKKIQSKIWRNSYLMILIENIEIRTITN